MYCKIPYNSLTIQPNGDLSICCASNLSKNIGHISHIDDIQKAWSNNLDLIGLRNNDQKIVNEWCGSCLSNPLKNTDSVWSDVNKHNFDAGSVDADGLIRYLEFTPSNICNQTCISCSSYYSSKWVSLEQDALRSGIPLDKWKGLDFGFESFGHQARTIDENDLEKIFKLLPNVQMISIKGGEPFADEKNYLVLKELIKVNKDCVIKITSNLSKLPEKYISLLSDANVNLTCSIDGVNETYEYIRSTNFNQTIDNLQRWYKANIKGLVNVRVQLSVYNMYHLNELLNFWQNFENKIIHNDNFMLWLAKWLFEPGFISPRKLFTQQQINDYFKSYNDIFNKYSSITYSNNGIFDLKSEPINTDQRKYYHYKFHKYTEFMNNKRKINIYKIHPELLNIGK